MTKKSHHFRVGTINPLSVVRRLVIRAKPSGAPPGTLVHTGERREDELQVSAFFFDEHSLEHTEIDDLTDLHAIRETDGRTLWLNVDGLHDVDAIATIGDAFDIHPLALEDILHVGQRPKVEEFGSLLFVVLHMLSWRDGDDYLDREQVSLVVGDGFVLSFQEHAGDVFEPVRSRLRDGGRMRSRGADYLLYVLMDAIVDEYYVVLERIGERVELLDLEVLDDPRPEVLHEIHDIKREMLVIRRAIWPVRELVAALLRSEHPVVNEETRLYLRDVYDHSVQAMDSVETLRDLASSLADLYLSSVGHRTNEVMKVLTVMASIFIPLTFIAGVYGMNFAHMPELQIPWAYPAVWAVMILLALVMVAYFKHKKWF